MTYSVFVQSTSERVYTAILIGWPFIRAEGTTKKEAIDKVRALLARLVASGDIVHIEVEEKDDEPVAEADVPDLWQELESLSAFLRTEALSDKHTVADLLEKLPEMRWEVCKELYGEKQVEAWEKERGDEE